jgi:hypothetical protein
MCSRLRRGALDLSGNRTRFPTLTRRLPIAPAQACEQSADWEGPAGPGEVGVDHTLKSLVPLSLAMKTAWPFTSSICNGPRVG